MALERRNPLPRGVYWQDFFTPPAGPSSGSIEEFTEWIGARRSSIKVLKTVYSGPGKDPLKAFVEGTWTLNPVLAAAAHALPDFGRARLWALFQVTNPIEWDRRFGFPTIAELTTEEQDTVQKPDPEPDVVDQIGDALKPRSVFGLLGESFAVLVAVVGAVASIKYLPGRKHKS